MKNLVVLYTLIIALAILAVFGYCRRPARPLVDTATAALLDSLQRTHETDSLRIMLEQHRSEALSRAADSAVARAWRANVRADSIGSQASATAAEARSVDSTAKPDSAARLWRMAYDERTAEADSLRGVIGLLRQADTSRVIARGIDTTAVTQCLARLARTDQANQGLRDAIARANRRGKLFGILPEPTRTESAVIGTVAGILVDQLVIAPRTRTRK